MRFVLRIQVPDKDKKMKMPERGKKRKNDDDGDSSQGESGSDWRESAKNHKHRNILAREKGVLTDITFEVGPAAIPFKVHKLILALASPVFEAMFYGDLAEKGDKIAVTDILPDGFDHMIQFIYTEEVYFKSEITAFQAWIAADKYCLSQLKKKCDAYLNDCALQPSNIWLMLENSVFINCICLTNRCLKYLRTHIESALHIPGFLETSADTLQRVLLMDPIEITELELLRALLRWAKYKVENEEAESNLEALAPLLKHVRFGAMSSLEFSIFMSESENLVCPQDAVSIFMHLSNPTCFKLPDWCSPKTFLRSYAFRQDGENSSIPTRDNKSPFGADEDLLCVNMITENFFTAGRRQRREPSVYNESIYHPDEDASSSSSSSSSSWSLSRESDDDGFV